MQPIITEVLSRRRDRCIAIMLGLKERECDKYLPREVQVKLRKAILDQINDYHDLCMDVMRSLDDGERTLNELYFERLEGKIDILVKAAEE